MTHDDSLISTPLPQEFDANELLPTTADQLGAFAGVDNASIRITTNILLQLDDSDMTIAPTFDNTDFFATVLGTIIPDDINLFLFS